MTWSLHVLAYMVYYLTPHFHVILIINYITIIFQSVEERVLERALLTLFSVVNPFLKGWH